jgi:hypothetical protein
MLHRSRHYKSFMFAAAIAGILRSLSKGIEDMAGLAFRGRFGRPARQFDKFITTFGIVPECLEKKELPRYHFSKRPF